MFTGTFSTVAPGLSLLAVCLFIPALVCTWSEDLLPKEEKCSRDSPLVYRNDSCGECGPPITVTLVARNWLVLPQFEFNATVSGQPQRELIHVLEWAADQEERFRFSATYHGRPGLTIDSINKLTGENRTFWHVQSVSAGTDLEEGISHYIPKDGEIILFNYTEKADSSVSDELAYTAPTAP